ncbi:hypothetical protein [Streptomyces sp. SBT349]|uniref:hypothetical protein n=1 Tax=Streptomyces sp. SBT349 TaxID=1580539 RepID=UPI00066B397D|nr:hypothetical protein [Streptomyces sp. SBT349]
MPGDLRPGPGSPGLWVSAPVRPDRPFSPYTARPPEGAYWCRCGTSATARGQQAVALLVHEWEAHQPACPARAEKPCEHCGKPTTERSTLSGWPAHDACYAAWAARSVEQRRRQQQIDGINARQGQRRKAAILRRQLERDGCPEQVIDAIVSGAVSVDA